MVCIICIVVVTPKNKKYGADGMITIASFLLEVKVVLNYEAIDDDARKC